MTADQVLHSVSAPVVVPATVTVVPWESAWIVVGMSVVVERC